MKNQTLADLVTKRDQLSDELQDEFAEVFAKDKALEKCLTDAENFENGFYFIDDSVSLCYCVDIDTDEDYSACIDELRRYILDRSGLYLDLDSGYGGVEPRRSRLGSIIFRDKRQVLP